MFNLNFVCRNRLNFLKSESLQRCIAVARPVALPARMSFFVHGAAGMVVGIVYITRVLLNAFQNSESKFAVGPMASSTNIRMLVAFFNAAYAA